MNNENVLSNKTSFLEKELIDEVAMGSEMMHVDSDATIIREGEYFKFLPITIECTQSV